MPHQLWVSASLLSAAAVDDFVASVACFLSREMQDGCSWESSAFCLTDTWAPTWLLLMLMPYVTPQHWSPLPPSSLGGVCLCHHFHSTICWHSVPASYPFIRVPNGKGILSPPHPDLCFWHDLKLSGVFLLQTLSRVWLWEVWGQNWFLSLITSLSLLSQLLFPVAKGLSTFPL